MYSFDYHKPTALDQALDLFKGADDPIFLAGGMTLIPTMKQRLAAPTDVIDLSGLDVLKGIALSEAGLSIGALTTHNEVATHPLIKLHLPVLAQLAATIGDNQYAIEAQLAAPSLTAIRQQIIRLRLLVWVAQLSLNRAALLGMTFFSTFLKQPCTPAS